MKVLLNSVDKVKNFAAKTIRIEEDIDLVSGRYLIDAKSIMGIFSLDLSKPIELKVHSENPEHVYNELREFEA